MLKECRLVIHNGTMDKIGKLGIKRIENFDTTNKFIKILDRATDIAYVTCDYDSYIKSGIPEVSDTEFMSWLEPFKVDDWVKFTNTEGSFVFKIKSISDTSCLPSNVIMNSLGSTALGFCLDACTKLTPNQIEVLNLNPKDGDI